MQTLTLAKIKKAALRYYKRGELIAQTSRMVDSYTDGQGHRCAIGAALNVYTLQKLQRYINDDKKPFSDFVHYNKKDGPKINAIIAAHDDWCEGKCDEKPLLALLKS